MKNSKPDNAKPLLQLQKEYSSDLSSVAVDFLTIGLDVLLGRKYSHFQQYQVPLANLCIGIELLLKSYIARRNLSLIHKSLPLDIRAILTCPDATPDGFRWESFSLNLRSAIYKTVDLGEVLDLFFTFRPDLKLNLHGYKRILTKCRNDAVHRLCPTFERYAAERVAFVALQLVKVIAEEDDLTLPYGFLEGENAKFISRFNEKRIERVNKALEDAKKAARKLDDDQGGVSLEGWEEYECECPVCKNQALLEGYTEERHEQTSVDDWDNYLAFTADSMECPSCGLKLEDSWEMELAGVESSYVRKTNMEKWYYDLHGSGF